MKKLLQLLMVPAFCLVSMQAGSLNVSAQQANCNDASISDTGAGSENKIICQDSNTVVIQCTNNTIVRIDLNQNSQSGNASSDSNTNAGSTTTGNASNESNNNIDVNSACGEAATTEQTPTPVKPEETPVATPVATPVVAKTATVLPNTGNETKVMTAGVITASVAGAAILAQTGISLFRKFSIK